MAKKHHPDKNLGGDDTKFKEIDAAYKILSDPNLKSHYDNTGSLKKENLPDGNSFQDVFSQFFTHAGNPFFTQFNQQQQRTTPMKSMNVDITLLEAYQGLSKKIILERRCICKECKGLGGKNPVNCTTCNGTGIVLHQQMNGPFLMQQQIQCPNKSCLKGKVVETKCTKCSASGYVIVKQEITIDIPKGKLIFDSLMKLFIDY